MTTFPDPARPAAALPDAPEPTAPAGRERVVIEDVTPNVDGGRFPIKRTVGERVSVRANAFADGHDLVACSLHHRHENEPEWREVQMRALGNDVFEGEFRVSRLGTHEYRVRAWLDRFGSWQRDLAKRIDAGQDIAVDLEIGSRLLRASADRAQGAEQAQLREAIADLADPTTGGEAALAKPLADVVRRVAVRDFAAQLETPLRVTVERERARFSSWYELFPRSASPVEGRHGTFADVEARLPYVASMGFDVLYLPPIHPIGEDHRKGPNNAPVSGPGDVGSPWAIGSALGGHTAIHPDLGTLADFDRLVARASEHELELALDIAFQCAPDHPWVSEHPEWFRHRPDGTIQYAENPPKRYQDIYPLEFECEEWPALWAALRDVVRFWIGHGIRIFRVDNPHTKPLPFWEWLIGEIRAEHPETIFLAEAFTRPKVMDRLAKAGFSQSYTYFTWRTTAHELREYVEELTGTNAREYFRPNFWPNTPDILPEELQTGNRATFIARLVLAATLSSSYGIYGPAFELRDSAPLTPGGEEYLDSEKYQLRHWNLDDEDSLRRIVTLVNAARRDNPALQRTRGVRFHETGNSQLLAYSKTDDDDENIVICVVSLDGQNTQSGWLELPLDELGIDPERPYQAHDLLGGGRYVWQGGRNFIELDPHVIPAHIFRVRRQVRTEHDFDYYQ
ncbi:MAG TPA: alpha-1,4-glucan--maltose-1-phosphate maltosyltransferase [Gaiellales bacterium]